MKKLDDINISLYPWFCHEDHHGNGWILKCDLDTPIIGFGRMTKADAQMASAAPDLYETLYDMIVAVEKREVSSFVISKAKKALNRASGSSVRRYVR